MRSVTGTCTSLLGRNDQRPDTAFVEYEIPVLCPAHTERKDVKEIHQWTHPTTHAIAVRAARTDGFSVALIG